MAASYILPADLPTFYDSRRVLMLVVDEDDDADASDLSNTATTAYANALSAIHSAASQLDTHCQMGKRYTRAVLENIIAEHLASPADVAKSKRAALIRQLVADLTFGILMGRRGYAADTMEKLAPRYKEALATLDRLAQGYQVFDLDPNIDAGRPRAVRIGANAYRPSAFNKMFGVWEDSARTYPYATNPYLFGRW